MKFSAKGHYFVMSAMCVTRLALLLFTFTYMFKLNEPLIQNLRLVL